MLPCLGHRSVALCVGSVTTSATENGSTIFGPCYRPPAGAALSVSGFVPTVVLHTRLHMHRLIGFGWWGLFHRVPSSCAFCTPCACCVCRALCPRASRRRFVCVLLQHALHSIGPWRIGARQPVGYGPQRALASRAAGAWRTPARRVGWADSPCTLHARRFGAPAYLRLWRSDGWLTSSASCVHRFRAHVAAGSYCAYPLPR